MLSDVACMLLFGYFEGYSGDILNFSVTNNPWLVIASGKVQRLLPQYHVIFSPLQRCLLR